MINKMQNYSKCMGCNAELWKIGFVGFCSRCAGDGTMKKVDRERVARGLDYKKLDELPLPKEVPGVAHDD
jgi:hypothetical protein